MYTAMKEMTAEKGYPIIALCDIAHVAKSAYYKWLGHLKRKHEFENEAIAAKIEDIHMGHPEKGHRQVRDDLSRDHEIDVSDKRILHLMRILGIQSTINSKAKDARNRRRLQSTLPKISLTGIFMLAYLSRSG